MENVQNCDVAWVPNSQEWNMNNLFGAIFILMLLPMKALCLIAWAIQLYHATLD
jgi:hypothetical protein